MNRRELLTGAAVLAGAGQAQAFGLGKLGGDVGRLGSRGGSSGPTVLPTFALEAETTAIIAAMTAAGDTPSANNRYFLNKTVKRLKAAGAFTLAAAVPARSRLYVFARTAAGGAARINWLNPGTGDATLQGTPTFTAGQGYSSSVAGSVLKTGVTLSQLSRDDVHIALWTNTYNATVSSSDTGALDSAGNGLTLSTFHQSSSSAVARVNGGVIVAPLGTRYTGGNNHVGVDRAASATVSFFRNGSQISTGVASASAAYVTAPEIVICGTNNNGTLVAGSGRVVNAEIILPSISSLTAVQQMEVYAAVRSYLNGVQYGEPELHDPGYQPALVNCDAVFLGCTPAGIDGAYRLKRGGFNPVIVGEDRARTVDHLGGQPANGLAYTDSSDFASIGGIPRARYTWINALLARSDTNTQAGFNVQGKFFNFAMRQMLDVSRTGGALPGRSIPIYFSQRVVSVTFDPLAGSAGLYTVITGDGRTFVAPSFFDCTYSQESFDAIGVPYVTGSEAAGIVLEANNGYSGVAGFTLPGISAGTTYRMDPYVEPGNPASGYIANVTDPPSLATGAADPTTQAMIFRVALTTDITNIIPWDTTPPPNYNAANYEGVGRLFALNPAFPFSDLFNAHAVNPAGTVYDFNTSQTAGGFSLDTIGSGSAWVAAQLGTAAAREAVYKDVENKIRGLFYWILSSGDSRIPAAIKTAMGTYFLLADQNLDPHSNDRVGWDGCVYVRQCRRIKKTTGLTFTGNDYGGATGSTPRSTNTIAVASYALDDHFHRLVAYDDGSGKTVWQQGGYYDITPINGKTRTPIPIEAIITDVGFAAGAGFASPTGPAMTAVALSAARMEPTMMEMGQALGAMAEERLVNNVDFRSMNYANLRARMLDGIDAVPLVLPQTN